MISHYLPWIFTLNEKCCKDTLKNLSKKIDFLFLILPEKFEIDIPVNISVPNIFQVLVQWWKRDLHFQNSKFDTFEPDMSKIWSFYRHGCEIAGGTVH